MRARADNGDGDELALLRLLREGEGRGRKGKCERRSARASVGQVRVFCGLTWPDGLGQR